MPERWSRVSPFCRFDSRVPSAPARPVVAAPTRCLVWTSQPGTADRARWPARDEPRRRWSPKYGVLAAQVAAQTWPGRRTRFYSSRRQRWNWSRGLVLSQPFISRAIRGLFGWAEGRRCPVGSRCCVGAIVDRHENISPAVSPGPVDGQGNGRQRMGVRHNHGELARTDGVEPRQRRRHLRCRLLPRGGVRRRPHRQ